MRRRLAFALLALLAGPACSWGMMVRPPEPPLDPTAPIRCTSSRAAPIVDTIAVPLVGIPSAVFTGAAIANPVKTEPCTWGSSDPGCGMFAFGSPGWKALAITAGLVGVGLAVMEGFSAADGYRWAATCEDLVNAQLACVSGVEASCAELRRPPPREGKSPGEACASADDCKEGLTCHLGRCQVAR